MVLARIAVHLVARYRGPLLIKVLQAVPTGI